MNQQYNNISSNIKYCESNGTHCPTALTINKCSIIFDENMVYY